MVRVNSQTTRPKKFKVVVNDDVLHAKIRMMEGGEFLKLCPPRATFPSGSKIVGGRRKWSLRSESFRCRRRQLSNDRFSRFKDSCYIRQSRLACIWHGTCGGRTF